MQGGTLRYEIAGGNSRNRFTISTSELGEGVLSLAQPLNFGQEEEFLLTVNAVDEGGRFGSCTVAIRVADANDHPPRFQVMRENKHKLKQRDFFDAVTFFHIPKRKTYNRRKTEKVNAI